MLLSVILQNFIVLHTRSARQALYDIIEDGEIGDGPGAIDINFADDNDGDDVMSFGLDTEVTIDEHDPSGFTVTDRYGVTAQFNAYTPANLTESSERDRLVDDIRTANSDFMKAEDEEGQRDTLRDLDAAWDALRNFDAKGIL